MRRALVAVTWTQAPVLVIEGSVDPFIPPAETPALYEAVPGPKALWLVPGGGHGNLYNTDPETYRQRVHEFLGTHLPVVP